MREVRTTTTIFHGPTTASRRSSPRFHRVVSATDEDAILRYAVATGILRILTRALVGGGLLVVLPTRWCRRRVTLLLAAIG